MIPAEDRVVRRSARNGWPLSTPALILLFSAAAGPLIIVAIYSFLTAGKYGNVEWSFSTNGWVGILWTKDIFDDTWQLADAHLTIFWRSVSLSFLTTLFTFIVGFPTAWFIATRPPERRAFWLFLITIPFWTNLLIRTYAINEVLRKEGLINTVLLELGLIQTPLEMLYGPFAIFVGMTYVYLPPVEDHEAVDLNSTSVAGRGRFCIAYPSPMMFFFVDTLMKKHKNVHDHGQN